MGRNRVLAALAATAVLTTTGCGSTDSAGVAASDSPSADLQTARDRVAEFTAQTRPMDITEPVALPAEPVTIVFLQCVQTVCVQIGDNLQEAVAAIGGRLVRIAHQDTPETVQQAAVNALQENPTAVIFSGDPTEWFADQLQEMQDRGIPVVGWSLAGGFTPDLVSANLLNQDDYYFHGMLMADYVLDHTDGQGSSVLLNVPAYPVLQSLGQGYTDEMARVCPDCSVDSVDFTVDDIISGNVATGAVAALQRNPDAAYLVGGFGGLITQQLAQAVRGAGFSDVRAISAAGTSANYELIRDGDLQEADLSLPTGYLAWRALDVTLRLKAGQEVDESANRTALAEVDGHPDLGAGGVWQEFVTADQLTGDNASSPEPWVPVEDYQQAFQQLWGVA